MRPRTVVAPCAYCHRDTDWPEDALRRGTAPCCPACRGIPLTLGIAWLCFAGVLLVFIAAAGWRLWMAP
jgi:hypothetical protein